MTTAQKTQSSNLPETISRISLPNVVTSHDDMTIRRESRSRFFYVAATLFAVATVAAFINEQPARVFLLGAVLSYGFGVMITTLEDLLELLNAYWAARSADEWENYARELHGKQSRLQRTIIGITDKTFGPIGNDRNITALDAANRPGPDKESGIDL